MNPEDVALPPHQSIPIPHLGAFVGHNTSSSHRVNRSKEIVVDQSALSVEYRKLMRWYPAEWRVAHEDAMLGILLDQADSESRNEPTRSEKTAIRRSGIAHWFGLPARGQRLSLIPLSLGAALSVFYAVFVIWAPSSHYAGSVGPFSNPSIATCVLFVLALVAALITRRKTASSLALSAAAVELTIGIMSSANQWQGPGWSAVILFVGIGVLSAGSFHAGISFVIGALLTVALTTATVVASWVVAARGEFTTVSVVATIASAFLLVLAGVILTRKFVRSKA